MDNYIEGRRGQFLKPSLEEQVKRLQMVVAKLATELDLNFEYVHGHSHGETHLPRGMVMPEPIPSTEEMVEMTLYPEHF